MRVLHITRDFPPRVNGGISVAVGGLVQSLGQSQHDIGVISFDGWRPRRNDIATAEVERSDWDARQIPVARLSGPRQLESALAFAQAFEADALHVHHSMLFPFAEDVARARSIPILFSVHILQRHQNRLRGLAHETHSSKAQSHALAHASVLHCPSQSTATLLRALHGENLPPIRVIPLGIDEMILRQSPATTQSRMGGALLYAGRLADINGFQQFLEALPAVLTTLQDCQVQIAGGMPDNPKVIKKWKTRWQRMAPEGLADRVTWLGWLPRHDLIDRYKRCRLQVIPSWFETFGLVAAETLALGTPIIATNAGALPEITGGDNGAHLIPMRDVNALTKGILTLWEGTQKRRQIAEYAQNRVRSTLRWSFLRDGYVDLYQTLRGHR